MLDGGCFCGAVRYRATGDPIVVSHCHCTDCRRASGAPFVTWMTVAIGDFAWTTGTPRIHRSSPGVERGFCGDCGTTLSFRHVDYPQEIDIAAGSLDEPDRITPQDHLWSKSMLPWIDPDDGLPRLQSSHLEEGYPEKE